MSETEYIANQHLVNALAEAGLLQKLDYDLLVSDEFVQGKILRIYSCKAYRTKLHGLITFEYTVPRCQVLQNDGAISDISLESLVVKKK